MFNVITYLERMSSENSENRSSEIKTKIKTKTIQIKSKIADLTGVGSPGWEQD